MQALSTALVVHVVLITTTSCGMGTQQIRIAPKHAKDFTSQKIYHHLYATFLFCESRSSPSSASVQMATPYGLIHYVGVTGRGEPVSLILEEAGASFTDTASHAMGKCREIVNKTLEGEHPNSPYYSSDMVTS